MSMGFEDAVRALLAPVGVVGNLVIVVAFLRDVEIMKSEGAFALLALSDLLYGLMSGWWQFEKLTSSTGELQRWRCLLRSGGVLATNLSHCTICCIAVDRIMKMRRPFDKQMHTWPRQRRMLKFTAATLLLVGALSCTLLGGGYMVAQRNSNATTLRYSDCKSDAVVKRPFMLAFVLLGLALGLVMVVLNGLVYFYLRKMQSKMRALQLVLAKGRNPGAAEQKNQAEQNSSSARLLMSVLSLFLVTWLCPGVLLVFHRYPLASIGVQAPMFDTVIGLIMHTADSVNAAANIVIYPLKHQQIRKSVLNLFRK